MSQAVVSLSVSFDSYLRHGWSLVPIPPCTKGPSIRDWNKREKCLTSSADIPHGWGAGLAHAYSGTMALDIDDLPEATGYLMLHGIDLAVLLNAHDAVTIDSGNNGHAKLLYRMPFGLALPSKKLIETKVDGTRFNFLDFRCGTRDGLTVQDVLPPSIHPTTLKPYSWGGLGHYERLPLIPQPLLEVWMALIAEDKDRTVKVADALDTSWDEINTALSYISPDVDRDEWIQVGMALHQAGGVSGTPEQAWSIFSEWSAKSEIKWKGQRDIDNVWRSFHAEDGITVGTLFHLAGKYGWHRPLPDVTELFQNVGERENPQELLNRINLRSNPPECDLSLFPPLLADRAKEVAHSIGCDPVVPLLAGLASVCAAVDARSRLRVTDSWSVPPVLWLMTIGSSSDKKSPGSRPMVKILDKLQAEDATRFKAESLIWKAHEARYASQMKAYQQHYGDAQTDLSNAAAPPVCDLPPEPKTMRLIVNDATSQMVIRMADGRPRGFLMMLDEMENWLKRVNDPRSGDDRGCWIQGYETGPYVMDRVTSGTVSAESMAIAIYGNVQPDVFKSHMAMASTDGLMQRFLPIVVDWEKTCIWEDIPEYLTRKEAFDTLIRTLFALPAAEYILSPEAKEAFRAFSLWYLELRRAEMLIKSGSTYLTALGKSEGTCLRLALVFHMVQTPTVNVVSLATMEQAIGAMKKYFIPSLRYAFVEIARQGSSMAEWLTEHIIQVAGIKQTITLSDIKRSSRRQTEGLTAIEAEMEIRYVMADLEEAKYVVQIDSGNTRSFTWAIDPRLADLFTDYRSSVIKARQTLIDLYNDGKLKKYGIRGERKAIGNK